MGLNAGNLNSRCGLLLSGVPSHLNEGGGAPNPLVMSITVAVDGVTITSLYNVPMSVGSLMSSGFSLPDKGSTFTETYFSGSGTTAIVSKVRGGIVRAVETPLANYYSTIGIASAKIGPNGQSLTVAFTESLVCNFPFGCGVTVTDVTAGVIHTATYVSGSGTKILVFTLSGVIPHAHVCTLSINNLV